MKITPTKPNLDAFVSHTFATLPDGIELRKVVLTTLLTLLPRGGEHATRARVLLASLELHETKQLDLALPTNHDGK